MSYLPVDQETNTQAPTGQTTNLPGQIPGGQPPPQSGGSTGTTPGGTSSAPAVGSAGGSPTQFGSSASKLGDYLSANSPQIQGQADTLAGNLNTQYGNLNQGITNAANQFQSQVQGGYAAPNQDLIGQAMADPTKFAADPNNVKAFQGQYNDTYAGPANFEGTGGYADIQNQVGQAVQQGNLLGSQAGLQSYLQSQGTNPTQAMSTLDSLLLRGNPDAQAKINTAAGQFGNLTGQLGTATTNADQSVADAQNAAQQAQAYAQGQFSNTANALGTNLTNQFGQNQKAYTDWNSGLSDLSNIFSKPTGGSLSAAQAAALGIQPGQFEQAEGNNQAGAMVNLPGFTPISPANYYTAPSQQAVAPTLGSSATPEQIAQMQALSQLSGGGYQAPFDPTQAGNPFALPSSMGNFDVGAFNQVGHTNLQNAYNTDLTNAPNLIGANPGLANQLKSVAAYLGQPEPDPSQFIGGGGLGPGRGGV